MSDVFLLRDAQINKIETYLSVFQGLVRIDNRCFICWSRYGVFNPIIEQVQQQIGWTGSSSLYKKWRERRGSNPRPPA